ncbi:MAG: flavodoxin family protein [Spirochaetales bacterium]|nr:flavodoxin family protein [Spirochaetales bacterium]
MKVLAINGSPHAKGNTAYAIGVVADELAKEGIETEVLTIGKETIHGCLGCGRCYKERNETCPAFDDMVNEAFQKIKEADGLILGSPIHYAGMAGVMSTFLDRLFYMNGANGNVLRHKAGVALGAVRRSGGIPAVNQLSKYLEYSEMVIPTSNYWNVIHGTKPGDAEQDAEGVQIMRVLGKNMAWLMKLIEAGKGTIPAPEAEKKVMTNFVR